MALLRCVPILLGLVLYIEAQTNTTDEKRPVVNSTSSNDTEQATPRYVLPALRRAVLILQTGNKTALRSDPLYNSLKYMEYDDTGALLNEVFMYSLKDVASFFQVYLGTKVCYNSC